MRIGVLLMVKKTEYMPQLLHRKYIEIYESMMVLQVIPDVTTLQQAQEKLQYVKKNTEQYPLNSTTQRA